MSVCGKRKHDTDPRKKGMRDCVQCGRSIHLGRKRCPHCDALVAPSQTNRAAYQRKLRAKKKQMRAEKVPNKCLICLSPPDFTDFSVFAKCECTTIKFVGCRGCLEQYVNYRLRPENRVLAEGVVRRADGMLVMRPYKTAKVICLVCNKEAKPRSAKLDVHGNPIPLADRYLRRLSPYVQMKVDCMRR